MLDRPKQCRVEDDLHPYQDYLREYALISEYKMLCQHHIPGLYMIPSANAGHVWFGVLFVRSGLYKGGIFRFTLLISDNFPDSTPPRVIFENKIFHPCINEETQELNVSSVFNIWCENENHVWQVLQYTSKIFYEIPTENSVNLIAADLYNSDIEKYKELVGESIESSKQSLFKRNLSDDAHYFRFEEFNETLHYDARVTLKSGQCRTNSISKRALSWINEGTLKPCSISAESIAMYK
ncbi:hypothetical protein O3M35_005858 [Rhynocoris fuscipes]